MEDDAASTQARDNATDEHQAAFAAGFEGTTTDDDEHPAGQALEGEGGRAAGDDAGSGEDAPGASGADATAAATPQQQYVQITREEWESALARQAELQAELAKLRDTATGQIGGLQRALTQAQTGAELTADDFASLRELGLDDVADSIARDLSNALKKAPRVVRLEQQSPAEPAQQFDEEQITRRVLFDLGVRGLEEAHPDFREVRDSADFRAFMASKPQQAQEEFASTLSPAVASRYFTEFKQQARQRAQASASMRRDRFAAAETPRGTATPPKRAQTERDAFAEGFRTG